MFLTFIFIKILKQTESKAMKPIAENAPTDTLFP